MALLPVSLQWLGDEADESRATALLGRDEPDIDGRYPCRFATVGSWFLLASVRTFDAVRRKVVDPGR